MKIKLNNQFAIKESNEITLNQV